MLGVVCGARNVLNVCLHTDQLLLFLLMGFAVQHVHCTISHMYTHGHIHIHIRQERGRDKYEQRITSETRT